MSNRLGDCASPYLQQHADNPVDWYPWGSEALELAARSGRPILLSIGYSACHWCHVMAHESFEDPDTAAVMNRDFVNIKVDREERPDLDRIYQLSHQVLAQRPGGWPLTMFLMPDDRMPFFGGTYFPRVPRHGLPAFGEILQRVAEYHREHGEDIERQNQALAGLFRDLETAAPSPGYLDEAPLLSCRKQLEAEFDVRYGGFGTAPKFPHAGSIATLLRAWHASAASERPDLQALYMASTTLIRMAEGGIYDQLGGGFSRYSVDDRWAIPHFEKMLYDNAALLGLYAETARATGDARFAVVAAETATWVLREMCSADGAFYSALDADSEGEEGCFYVWTREALETALGDDYAIFASRYGVDGESNFEGRWHLTVARELDAVAEAHGLNHDDLVTRLDRARAKLLALREQRVRPGLDDKVLVSWNGQMIGGLARAARHLQDPEFADAALRAANFIHATLWRDGQLHTAWKDGAAHAPALLDDHAYLLDGLLQLLQLRWQPDLLRLATELADTLLSQYQDDADGGLYLTPHDHEPLVHRPMPLADDATPSGNGVAAAALIRLGHLLGETHYLDAAERILKRAWSDISRMPMAHTSLLEALELWLSPPETLVIRGDAAVIQPWLEAVLPWYWPGRQTFAIPADATDLPGLLEQRVALTEGPVAYLCRGTQCDAPVRSLEALMALLGRPDAQTDTEPT